MKPLFELKNYPVGFSDILKKFEAGKPLSADQLNFINSHQRSLSNTILDPVLRYYLLQHKLEPDKALPLKLSEQKLTSASFQQVRQNIHLLLRNHFSHVDLEMSPEQFQQFKALGLEELQFWHGDNYLLGSVFHHAGLPYRLYFQWGRMFGVVQLHLHVNGKHVEGKVFIFVQDMHQKTLKECIDAYTHQLKEQEKPEQQFIQSPELALTSHHQQLPRLVPNFVGVKANEKE